MHNEKPKGFLFGFCDKIHKYMESIHNDVHVIKELLMGIQNDLKTFADQVDAVTNTIAANITVVAQKIEDLQNGINAGTITDAEVAAALDPVKAHLQTVSDSLAAVASGGTPVVPPVEPIA